MPTGRLAAVAAGSSVAVGLFPGDSTLGLLVVNGLVLVVALVDWALTVRPAAVAVERELPAVVTLGQSARIMWWVGNPGGRRLRVSLADELAPSLRAGRRRLTLIVPGRGRAGAGTDIRPARRGRFELREMVVRVEGPVGLMARQERRMLPATMRVYPQFASRDEAELRINRARILQIGLRSAQGRGGGTEFDSMREYGPDDEFRRIDWAATARAGKPIVRTYRAERNQTVLLLLDNGRVMAGRVADVPRLEHAMDAVMMLAAVATRLGDRAGLVAFDREVRAVVPPSHSAAQLTRVTEAMYSLQPELVESDYEGAFVETLARFRRRAMLVILTELAEQALADTLVPALPLIVRDHLVVLGSVQDPAVVASANSSPDSPAGSYAKAAAVAALEERRRLVGRLRGMGATVVDAPPGRLAPGLADAYLKVKATGRL
ncbi:MAG: DUF58 domain-containing protein [Actinobacteria bacterium]|nr:DUF58 domain-containing protein [Actinomycetota bacterium]MBW3649886.1 DUF58 domain-containing protein [Actinomycetota bacterium]